MFVQSPTLLVNVECSLRYFENKMFYRTYYQRLHKKMTKDIGKLINRTV